MFAAGLLEEHGFEVIEAENAAAALRELEAHRDVRLLFTDIQMPGRSERYGLGARGARTVAERAARNYVRSGPAAR